MFNILKRNRVTEDRAINNLVVSIKKRGQIQPIIVNQDLELREYLKIKRDKLGHFISFEGSDE